MSKQLNYPALKSWMGFLFIYLILADLAISSPQLLSQQAPIKLGKCVYASGDGGQVGRDMIVGSEIYIKKINKQGGLKGRKIVQIVKDDRYDPLSAAKYTRQLIDKDQVLALLGNNGTPSLAVTLPIILEKKILLFAPNSGAFFLRKIPPDRYVFTLRLGFAAEAKAMIKRLYDAGIKPNEIAFFIQNDAYGENFYQEVLKVLKESGYPHPENLPIGRFSRNTLNIEGALASISDPARKPPRAIIQAANYQSNAKFIHLASKLFPNTFFVIATSLVSPKDLSSEEQKNVLATNVVPSPDSDLPAAHDYLADLKKYGAGASPDFTSFESYLGTKLFVIALQKAIDANKLTREGIIDVLENMKNIDIGIGETISFSKTQHEGLHKVWTLRIKDGKYVDFDWAKLKSQR